MAQVAEFELLVLLAVMHCGESAYSVAVHAELERRSRRRASMGAVYVTLERLETKGFLSSQLGQPTAERGGRAKRFYAVTRSGRAAVADECRVLRRMTAGLNFAGD